MKKKLGVFLAMLALLVIVMQSTANAAQTMTIAQCAIVGDQVSVIATGTQAPSDSGEYYLFSLEPYEAGVGARQDFCAKAPAGPSATFSAPLGFNTASSKLYSRFVVTALQGGQYVPISNECYITNPEVLASRGAGQPRKSNKGIIVDAFHTGDLTDLGCGYACYILNVSQFCNGSGVNYTYNGKNYSFAASAVAAYDMLVPQISNQGVNLIIAVLNNLDPSVPEMVPPLGRVPGMSYYSFNVQEQGPTEKLEALMSFLAERYNGGNGHGAVHSWIVGNECNNNQPAHYCGSMTVEQFSVEYGKQFRLLYNAILSKNKDAKVYTNIDQRWAFVDKSLPLQYPGKAFLDNFAAYIKATGDVNWSLSVHPHAVPMSNGQVWNVPAPYSGMKLINTSDNSKFVSLINLEVFVNHMKQPALLSPAGTVRDMIITELGFNSMTSSEGYASNEQIQIAALAYGYKKFLSLPEFSAFLIHQHMDAPGELGEGRAYGLKTVNGVAKPSYSFFKTMDTNPASLDVALPTIGATSWAQLGIN